MTVKGQEVSYTEVEKLRGGEGKGRMYQYLKDAEITSKLNGFNVMVLEKGASIGYHQHLGNEEVYFVLSGKGLVTDNGKEYEVGESDLIFTGNGSWHGLKNIGDSELRFAAFIVGI